MRRFLSGVRWRVPTPVATTGSTSRPMLMLLPIRAVKSQREAHDVSDFLNLTLYVYGIVLVALRWISNDGCAPGTQE